ncbi:MAG: LysM peptidoglycan-binding domain-containing protein [Candidatus Rifleibacteriota bacterium]
MIKRHRSYLLSCILMLTMSTCGMAQSYYEVAPPEGYSPSEYQEQHLYSSTGSDYVNADSSWVEEDTLPTGYQTYTIKKGDTLGSISKKFFGTSTKWRKIAGANNISDPTKIKVGQMLEIPTTESEEGQGVIYRQRTRHIAAPATTQVNTAPAPDLPLPPVTQDDDAVIYSDAGLPQIILPGEESKRKKTDNYHVTFNGLTGLVNTFAAYPLGENVFSTAFGIIWNKIARREGNRLKDGEDGDYWEFPMLMTYAGESFEVAFKLPFESYDIFAPITYNFRDGSDSGMGDASLRLKFSSENDDMASCLGLGAIFPTSDIDIGNTENDNAWEVFAGISSKKKDGGNFHVNGGYQAGDGNTTHEGIFVNAGFEYDPNESFTFMGEINFYNRINSGRSTDLTLGMRYHVKEGMSLTLAAPIALSNDMFFGYDYRMQGMLQYHY